MRRTIVGGSNVLRLVYGEVLWLDDARATVIHAHHTASVQRVSQMPALALPPTYAALTPEQQRWADHIASTPMFLNAFGQQGWSINLVELGPLLGNSPLKESEANGKQGALSKLPERIRALDARTRSA